MKNLPITMNCNVHLVLSCILGISHSTMSLESSIILDEFFDDACRYCDSIPSKNDSAELSVILERVDDDWIADDNDNLSAFARCQSSRSRFRDLAIGLVD